MFFDSIAITVSVLLVLLTVWSSLSDTLRRNVVSDDGDGENVDAGKPISVIVVSDNNADALSANLPVYLSQDYPAGYEVIVVVDRDEDGTADVLKSFNDNPLLYTTFVPDSSRYMSRRKLAITLGVKAAKNEWILLTDAAASPVSGQWLRQMSSHCCNGIDMVIGYSGFADEASSFKRFYRLHRSCSYFHDAVRARAYGMAGCNLMFRKSIFMAGNGFLGNLKYLRGEFEFLVNKYSDGTNVAVATVPDSYIVEEDPSLKKWHDMNVFHVETRRHLSRGFRHCAAFVSDVISLSVCLLASIAALVWAVLASRWVILPFAVVAIVLPVLFRTLAARHIMEVFGVRVPVWLAVPFEVRLVWHNLKYTLLHKLSDKNEFISHKS